MMSKTMLGLMVCGMAGCFGQLPAANAQCGCCCGAPSTNAVPTAALTEAEVRDLLLMREEEKLARDVYLTLGEKYNQRVFVNIPRAEQQHMESMLGLLKAYGLEDPSAAEPNRFNNATLQKLYAELVARGSKSAEEAYLVGALVEELDIRDLMEAMKRTNKENIRAVYENLLGGSTRHLNAFVRNYEAVSGKTYRAQKLTQTQVDGMLGR